MQKGIESRESGQKLSINIIIKLKVLCYKYRTKVFDNSNKRGRIKEQFVSAFFLWRDSMLKLKNNDYKKYHWLAKQ